MSDTPTTVKSAAQEPDPATDVSSPIDEQLHSFWKKNGQAIMIGAGILLVGYLGKAGWDMIAAQHETGIQEEYAVASTPQKLKEFITSHPDHPLAGVAQLQIADQDYASGNVSAAITDYTQAVSTLKTGPLAGRAQLGLAMAQIQSGQVTEGQASLRQISEDTHQMLPLRAEATYQLASLAASAGRADEVQKLSLQILQMDSNSPWAQRAFSLQVSHPASSAGAPAPAAGAPASAPGSISFKPGTH